MGHVLILLPEPLWQQPSPICRARHKRERSPGPPDDSCFLQAGSHPVGQAVLVWASLDVGSKRVHTAAPHGRHGDSLEELDAFTFGGAGGQRSKASVWHAVGKKTCRDSMGRPGTRLKHCGTGLKGGCGLNSGLQRGISLVISGGGKATHPADFGGSPGRLGLIPRILLQGLKPSKTRPHEFKAGSAPCTWLQWIKVQPPQALWPMRRVGGLGKLQGGCQHLRLEA